MASKHAVNWKYVLRKLVSVGPKVVGLSYVLKWCYGLLLNDGKAAGGDFVVYWWAAHLVRDGAFSVLYDFTRFQESVKGVTGPESLFSWFYPPTFLLFILPFSVLPYSVSLVSWILITFVAYRQVVVRIAQHHATTWLLLAFPATLLNIGYGQNGFLSAALLGGGLLLLEDHPYVAGVFLGLFTYKPQLAVLVPVALIFGRAWKAALAFALSVGSLILLSCAIFGLNSWIGFWNNLSVAGQIVRQGFHGQIQNWHNMISIFSSARLLRLDLVMAQAVQVVVMCGALLSVLWVWAKKSPLYIRGSTLAICALLFSPYALEYDLALLALPIAWMGWHGYMKGWLYGEKIMLIVAWFMPLLSKWILQFSNIQLIPVFMITLLAIILRRAAKEMAPAPAKTTMVA